MQHETLSKIKVVPFNEDCPRSLNVTIVYDTRQAGQRAVQLFTPLGRQLAVDLKFQPWRFDLLAEPEWSAAATDDVMSADLLTVSSTAESDLPPAVRTWIEACAERKRSVGGAMVALLGPEGKMDHGSSRRFLFLQRAAQDAGMEFFAPPSPFQSLPVCRYPEREQMTEAMEFPGQIAQSPSQTVVEFPAAAIPRDFIHTGTYRHWGINE